MKKIIVLFKTHLDVGFTELSKEIIRQYNEEYIPKAIAVGEEILARGRKEGFVWTTGSFLPYQYLKQGDEAAVKKMTDAINMGIFRWHGLPVTMHSEIATPELFEYGLTISEKLDERFGIKTIGAKYTDVPGHTCGIIPLMVKHGLKLLHIGVNPASMPPDVPELFRWRAPEGEEIIVMYNKGYYGEFSEIPGTDTAVLFAHTNDNKGPQSADEIIEIYDKLHDDYPEAEVVAGDLNDVARVLLTISDSLPVVTEEMGDTWIHGGGTDPKKINMYRGLLRAAKTWDKKAQDILYDGLLMIPEHTWGLDEKTHLNDHEIFSREKFDAARNSEKFKKMESSWQEQREYIYDAVRALPEKERAQSEKILEEYRTDYPNLSELTKTEDREFIINGWSVAFDEGGAVVSLKKGEKLYADENHRLCEFMYEAFSEKEVLEYGNRYMSHDFDWAREDFGKIGLSGQMDKYVSCKTRCTGVYRGDNFVVLTLACPQEYFEKYGCPKELVLKVTFNESVVFDFSWYNKPASRIPEALWLGFNTVKPLTAIKKLGVLIDPKNVISNGNREMHFSQGTVYFEDITLEAVDLPLLSIDEPRAYSFRNEVPRCDAGVWFNQFNNQWGTNFPMWYEGDGRFRYILS